MPAQIINNRVDGTRITVWDVYYYLDLGRSREWIAELFNLSVEQIQAAIDFINENRGFVEEGHRQIEERNARGNPPEIEQKLAVARAKREAWFRQRQEEKARQHDDAGYPGGR